MTTLNPALRAALPPAWGLFVGTHDDGETIRAEVERYMPCDGLKHRLYTEEQMHEHAAKVTAALRERVEALEPAGVDIVGYALKTDLNDGNLYEIRIERVRQRSGPPLWTVRDQFGSCLSRDGEWEDEPMPSSRDDAFIARCRFATAREAIDTAIAAEKRTGEQP